MNKQNLTDAEIVAMTHSYDMTRDGSEYICHLAYKEINRQGAEGRQWAKCPNCGNPYPMDQESAMWDCCSPTCFEQYVKYVADVAGWK